MSSSDEEARSRELSERLGFPVVYRNGWIVRQSRGGPPVTNELVQRLLDQAVLEDAGLEPPPVHLAGETDK